jgi:integrase
VEERTAKDFHCDRIRSISKIRSFTSHNPFRVHAIPTSRSENVRKAWRTTLKRAGVSYFQIYNLRHVFCTRLSWVAPDAVVQRAMRHSSPETKRVYQMGLVHQVREHMERANDKAY